MSGLAPGDLDSARQVADAVLYEGYLLYPYHQGAQKNQLRFQFGVLMPPAFAGGADGEASWSQTQCLLDAGADDEIDVRVRFLQLQSRAVQVPGAGGWTPAAALTVAGTQHTAFEEAVEHEQQVRAGLAALLAGEQVTDLQVPGGEDIEELPGGAGRLVRTREPLALAVSLRAEPIGGPAQTLRLTVRVDNMTKPPSPPSSRAGALAHALIAAHSLVAAARGRFLSLTDPPEWAAGEAAACQNVRTWPVLAGPDSCDSLVLSAPLILPDHPQIAAESAGNLFDGTEIDEILTLRTMALTDTEKQQARATDPRAAQIIDRVDHLPPEMLEKLHGAIRYAGGPPALPGETAVPAAAAVSAAGTVSGSGTVPWWDPGSDASVSPATDHVVIEGVRVARDSRVIMAPGSRRADAQDLFLAGREAVVEAVLFDVDGQVHLALTPADDPAADLSASHGRFLYFAPDEVRPLRGTVAADSDSATAGGKS